MKKALVFVLVVILAVAMVVPAYAANNPTTSANSSTTTFSMPVVVDNGNNPYIMLKLIPFEEVENLPEEAQEIYADAQESLLEAMSSGMEVLHFFYPMNEVFGDIEKPDFVDLTIEVDSIKNIVVKQFIDDEWVEMEIIIHEDGTVTVKNAVEAPMAVIFVCGVVEDPAHTADSPTEPPAHPVGSPTAPAASSATTSPLPVAEDGNSYIIVKLVPVERAESLQERAQRIYAAAQESLPDAVPDGMKVLYFFSLTIEVSGDVEKPDFVDVTFQIDNFEQIVVKQFINDEWVEIETIIHEDGTVTVKNAVEAPMAIFAM